MPRQILETFSPVDPSVPNFTVVPSSAMQSGPLSAPAARSTSALSPPIVATQNRAVHPDANQVVIELYCRVVDNLGDAGVCWRLARQLVHEHGHAVRMWIDDPTALARIEPSPAAAGLARAPTATVRGVSLRHWRDDGAVVDDDRPADVVISAFNCELPTRLRRALAGGPQRPLWINLEYLSAESWVDGCHRLSSVKPDDAAVEWFFYPGFTAATGGLLRESSLFTERDRFIASGAAAGFLHSLGVPAATGDGRRVSLFCYPLTELAPWLAILADDPRPTTMLVPDGVADDTIAAFSGAPLPIGRSATRGRLTLVRVPFVAQDDYDRLLWSCDLNVVRGEDSWIRAQWAARPFVWLPYPQPQDAHRVKLDAFLARLVPVVGDEAGALIRAWDGRGDRRAAWQAFERVREAVLPAFVTWAARLAACPDLATSLDRFIGDRL